MPENKSLNESVSDATELSNDDLDKVAGGGAVGDAAGAAQHSGLFKAVTDIAHGLNQGAPIVNGAAAGAAGGAGPKPS